jgi:hypothetical protein
MTQDVEGLWDLDQAEKSVFRLTPATSGLVELSSRSNIDVSLQADSTQKRSRGRITKICLREGRTRKEKSQFQTDYRYKRTVDNFGQYSNREVNAVRVLGGCAI